MGGPVQTDGDLPPYIIPGSDVDTDWRESNPKGHKILGQMGQLTTGSTELHISAQLGDKDEVERLLETYADDDNNWVNLRDKNGWSALHEAARIGATDIVKLLVGAGAHIDARTGRRANGESVLALAKRLHGSDHSVVHHLVAQGAREIGYGTEL